MKTGSRDSAGSRDSFFDMDFDYTNKKMEHCLECGAYGPGTRILAGSTGKVTRISGERRQLHSKNCATAKIYRKIMRIHRKKVAKLSDRRAKRARLKAEPASAGLEEQKQT